MTDLVNLKVEKLSSTSRWQVLVQGGPCDGMRVGYSHDLKRDAVAAAESLDHLPWKHVQMSLERAAEVDEVVVAVPTMLVQTAVERLARLEQENALYRTFIIDLNPEIIARFGHGGAMEIDRRKKEALEVAECPAAVIE